MAKVNFTKAEKALEEAMQRLFIENLSKSDDEKKGTSEILFRFKEQLAELKKEIDALQPTHEDLIEKERKRYINKRHNVKEGWLPLK